MRSPDIIRERAKLLRRTMTRPERTLWSLLRRNEQGWHFRRQHPIGPFILDFYCAAAKLAVEVDGAVHAQAEQAAHDGRRSAWLGHKGIRVIRIKALDVRDELDGVLEYIAREAKGRIGG